MASKGSTENKKYLSHTLSEWATHLKFEHLSPQSIQSAKLFWFDSMGCALGGSQQPDAKILLEHFREMAGQGATGACGTFVSGFRTNPSDAAFMNAHMMRAMDYNDIYWKADPCHPSDIISGPLAICEMKNLSGKDLILATIIAYEIEMRLCEAGIPGVREYGWHHATLTAFAAPIAAGRALNLTVDQMVNAIGISAVRSFSPGASTAGKLTNMKNVVDPWACRMGVESALLAKRGFTGPEHMIDGKEGLYAVFGHVHYKGQPAKFDSEKLTGNLPRASGDHYKIIDCGMKSFPIEALSHAPLTAMMKAVKENNLKPSDVREIKVEVIARAADILGDPHKYRPDSKETADHSLPYCMAVGLIDGMVTPLQFKEERVMDQKLQPIMDMVKVVANDEFEALFPKYQPSQVTITTGDGKKFTKRVDVPKGDPRDPMTEDEIAVKFNALGKSVVGEARCNELRRWIMSMERQDNLSQLIALTQRSAGEYDAAMHELLEPRRLLTATLDPDGTLTVVGTDSADVISLAPNGATLEVTENASDTGSFNIVEVTAIFITARDGNDVVRISNGLPQSATILGGAGNDTISGGGGNDSIKGEAGADRLDGGKRNDRLEGDDGNDVFAAAALADGDDRFTGGAGNDTVDYTRRSNPITVTGGRLDITSGLEHDVADDVIETLIGSSGNDNISVDQELSSGDAILAEVFGGKGDDKLGLTPLGRSVTIHGGDGNDQLTDAAFTDLPNEVHFFGDAGHDVIRASAYPTIRIIRGGAGIDTADFSFSVGGSNISLDNVANDFVPSRFLPDNLIGNVFDDVENLIGAANGSNTLVGSDGNNVFTLHGLAPSTVRAMGGNDIIVGNRAEGSTAADTIDGGAGIDMCEEDSRDTITGIESTFAWPGGDGGANPNTRAKPPAAGSSLSRGKLSVFGSTGDDFIRITQTSAGITVSISGLETKVYSPASSVKTISINAQAGNDEVVMFKKNGTGRVTRHTAIFGSDGDDVIFAGDGSFSADSDARGGSQLTGGRGNDLLVGGNGRDFLDGGDQLAARASTVDADDGVDTMIGGDGDDFVTLQSRNSGARIRLRGSRAGNAAEDQISGIENVLAGRGDDTILGDGTTNLISGGFGADTVRAGAGLDFILPNFGADEVFVDDDDTFDFVKLSDDLLADTCFKKDDDFVSTDSEDVLNNS